MINVDLLFKQTQQKVAKFLGGLNHIVQIDVLPKIAQHAEESEHEQTDLLVHIQPLLPLHLNSKSPAIGEYPLQLFFRREGIFGVQTAHIVISTVQTILARSVNLSQIIASQAQIRVDSKRDSELLESRIVSVLVEENRAIHQDAAV